MGCPLVVCFASSIREDSPFNVKPALSATTAEMNIYVCIIPEMRFSRISIAPLDTTAVEAARCGMPDTSGASAF
jgi:hypothetical protein